MQDVILTLCERHREVRDLEGLLLTAARRRAIDLRRRAVFTCALDDDEDALPAACEGTPEDLLLRRERYVLLNRAACLLPEAQFTALQRRVAGDSDAAIAREAGVSENAVQQRISRAVATVRSNVAALCEADMR